MATSIQWTDTIGAVTLTNDKPTPGDRFTGWVPLTNPVGPLHHALGTGVPYKWSHRTDYGAKFSLTQIPNSRQQELVRLKRHLMQGGSIIVATGDPLTHTYTTCYLWPDSEVEISPPDPKTLERKVTLSVLNADGADMVATYA